MWIKHIEKYQGNNPYIKINPPSDESAIKEAERKLDVVFPEEVKALLLQLNGDNYLIFSVQQIIDTNLETRAALGEVYEGLDELLFIGGNGCGDYYSYVITDGAILSNTMVRWEHEDNSRTVVANGLEELIDKYYTDQI